MKHSLTSLSPLIRTLAPCCCSLGLRGTFPKARPYSILRHSKNWPLEERRPPRSWKCTSYFVCSQLKNRNQFCRWKSGSSSPPDMEVVYTAPLKGAVRAIKVFSLTTAVASFFGGPCLVWLGNPSVPLAGRLIMTSLVMLVGLGTTALLHWLVKGITELTLLWDWS